MHLKNNAHLTTMHTYIATLSMIATQETKLNATKARKDCADKINVVMGTNGGHKSSGLGGKVIVVFIE